MGTIATQIYLEKSRSGDIYPGAGVLSITPQTGIPPRPGFFFRLGVDQGYKKKLAHKYSRGEVLAILDSFRECTTFSLR